jgi:hypothetical protein
LIILWTAAVPVLHDVADLQQNMTGLPVNLGVADAAFIFNDIDSG